MMRRFLTLAGAMILLLASPGVRAAGDDDGLDEFQTRLGKEWQLVRFDTKRNIKTWVRQEDGKTFRTFKVQAELEGSMEAVARLMLDFPGYEKWYWQVLESRLLKQVSPVEYVVYVVHRAPTGLPDRDVVLRGTVTPQTRSQRVMTLRIVADPDYLPAKPPRVRMPAQEMTSRFQPLENGKVLLETEGYVDPGGKVPVWAANFVQRQAPYAIMVAMERRLQSGDYDKGKPLPFPVYGIEAYR